MAKKQNFYTYLDIDEVKENKQQNINDVEEKDLPEKIEKEIKLKN